MPPTLPGRHVLLRPPTPADADALTRILAEPEVARFWHGYDRARVAAELIALDEAVVFVIEREGEVAGAIQYTEQNEPDYRHVGVDLFLGARWHGQGYGTDAIRAVLGYCFGELGHHRAVIDPSADNAPAIRAYEAVGFQRVGRMRQYERGADGTWHDGLLLDLLAGELRGG